MLAKHRTIHWVETYRFSATRTISDYPLLIGEILFRSELARGQAKRKNILYEIRHRLTSYYRKGTVQTASMLGQKRQEVESP